MSSLVNVVTLCSVGVKMQIPLGRYVVRVKWTVVGIMVFAGWACIQLGLWQWHKAEQKQAITQAVTQSNHALSPQWKDLANHESLQALHLQTVTFSGHYLPAYSFLLDNQVHQGQAGFHVITPFLIDDRHLIWVNRGWVAGFAEHNKTPQIDTPTQTLQLTGLFWVPKKTAFRLDQPADRWQAVQSVVDFNYLKTYVPYRFPAAIVKLDPQQAHGYVRAWDVPVGQVEKHLSYAYQWFGFALASLLIGLYQMIEKRAV